MKSNKKNAILAYQRALAEQALQQRLQAKQQYDHYLRNFTEHLVAQTEEVLNQLSHTWPELAELPEWPTAPESTRRELFREHMRNYLGEDVDQNSGVWQMLRDDGFTLLQRTYEQDASVRTDISGTVNALAESTKDFQTGSADLMYRMQLMEQYISIAGDQPENFEQHFLGNAELLNRLATDGIVLQKPDFHDPTMSNVGPAVGSGSGEQRGRNAHDPAMSNVGPAIASGSGVQRGRGSRPRPEVSVRYEERSKEAGKKADQREARRRRTGRDEQTEEFLAQRQGLAKAQRESEAKQRRDEDMAEIERLRKQDKKLARQRQSPTAKKLEKKLRREKP